MGKDPNLGKTGTDKVTGLEGVVTGRVDYLDKESLYLISPKKIPGTPLNESNWVPIVSVVISD